MQFSRNFLFGSSKPSAPRGHRAYAVGDIHGRLDLLDDLLARIEADARGRRQLKTTIVFLGDLIDRGPDSRGVIERLRTYRPDFAKTAFILGNHEEVMLRVIAGEAKLLQQWLRFGGAECLVSYGLDPATLKDRSEREAAAIIERQVPASHLEFLRSFADTVSFGSYFFVHAGIRPGTSLAEQSESDLRWIREPFLADERDHGSVIVHGHTITQKVDVCANRIGIDTGGYRTGVLTALGLESTRQWFLQTEGENVAASSSARVAHG
ncbi:serine/threonine protein phosphatase [Sphingomonas sinipercae]|uniref:Serine/threonine protein phosphatase n=1 Tax=Sphingomonas sinipercae TaxID=2714944 RepID=A0A6G7ZNA1_9SPHN|nr:metallophosphoesterase [Sphingomonas sinipercae]QIL02413.1 serine/threonine protein phosphatase [Sphingomonas sinipercae]